MSRSARVLVVVTMAAALHAAAATPDYAREERWAQEIAPQVVVGDPVWLSTRERSRILALYAEPSAEAKGAVIVVHGAGVHPDWELIGALRTELAERGFATLAVQMPVLAADASRNGYPDLFPAAGERLDAAIAWLRGKGHSRIGVVSHSIGAAMADAALARKGSLEVDAWIPLGMLVDFTASPRVPVLDIIAERDYPEATSSARTRAPRLPKDGCSRGIVVANTDHFFEGATSTVVNDATAFLSRAFARECARDRASSPR